MTAALLRTYSSTHYEKRGPGGKWQMKVVRYVLLPEGLLRTRVRVRLTC